MQSRPEDFNKSQFKKDNTKYLASPCQFTSDFEFSPHNMVSSISGPVHTGMGYYEYSHDLLQPLNTMQQEHKNFKDAASYVCERVKPATVSPLEEPYNAIFTTSQRDYNGPHHRQSIEASSDERFENNWRSSLPNHSSPVSWEEQINVDLNRRITGEMVSNSFLQNCILS